MPFVLLRSNPKYTAKQQPMDEDNANLSDQNQNEEQQPNQPIQWAVMMDIPSQFCAEESGEPISNCLICDKYLLDDGTEYLIEKSVRRYPELETETAVFELAVCLECAERQRQSLSKESLQNIENYFREHYKPERSVNDLLEAGNADAWLESCSISGSSLADATEYQICGFCNGNQMVFGHFPYVLSGAVLEELADLLSEKTLDEMNGFTETYFGMPPEFADLFKDKPVLVF